MPYYGGVDIGGTKVLSVCLDAEGLIVGQDLCATEAERGPEAVVKVVAASLRTAAQGRELAGIGISMAGILDPKRGVVSIAPNLPGWRDVPLVRLVGERLGLPVALENDANAAALAEHRLGAGRGATNMILVTIGTGLGAGLVLNGRLYSGASGAAGEVGHMQLDPDGPPCSCGRRGCLEALAAGWALARRATEIIGREPGGLLTHMAAKAGGEPDARLLEDAANAGDASAAAAIDAAGRALGAGLANLVNLLNPEVIVIGGGLRKLGDRYLGPAQEVMRREAFAQSVADVRVVEAGLGDEAPAIGAALLAQEAGT
jgi:glucokinase